MRSRPLGQLGQRRTLSVAIAGEYEAGAAGIHPPGQRRHLAVDDADRAQAELRVQRQAIDTVGRRHYVLRLQLVGAAAGVQVVAEIALKTALAVEELTGEAVG